MINDQEDLLRQRNNKSGSQGQDYELNLDLGKHKVKPDGGLGGLYAHTDNSSRKQHKILTHE